MREPSPRVTPTIAWQLGLAALANATYIARAARVLLDEGFFGPARSLAISSREETGKFFRLLPRALELPEQERPSSLRDHKVKQALGIAIAFLPRIADLRNMKVDIGADGIESADGFLRTLSEKMADSAEQWQLIESEVKLLDAEIEAALAGEHESLRQAGLYVDLAWLGSDWKLRSPGDVTVAEAALEVDRAEAFGAFTSLLEAHITVDARLEGLPVPDLEVLRQVLSQVVRSIAQA